jgi:cyclophilin family peptidyl-prolyl cis-trans isomerase
MVRRMRRALLLALALLLLAPAARADNPIVRFITSLGGITVELCQQTSAACPGAAPNTVANFLKYVDEDRYVPTTIIDMHNSTPDFIQGGAIYIGHDDQGDFWNYSDTPYTVARELDPNLHNVRGTLAMIYEPTIPGSSNWWFMNVADNLSLDTVAGGYAVFGVIIQGLGVLDAIAALPVYDAILGSCPLIDYPGPPEPTTPHHVFVTSTERVPEPDVAALLLVAGGTLATLRRRAYPRRP